MVNQLFYLRSTTFTKRCQKNRMSPTGKSVAVVVLSYLLFGLFNLTQYGAFVVPVTYIELVVFILAIIPAFTDWKGVNKLHLSFLIYALLGLVGHPFMWEIVLDQQAQLQLFDHLAFDILKILQIVVLAYFFYCVSYDEEKHRLRIEWLVPAALTIGLFFNPAAWYIHLLFMMSGFSASYAIQRRMLDDAIYPILIGIGILYTVNAFYI